MIDQMSDAKRGDPYRTGKINTSIFSAKSDVIGSLCAVMGMTLEGRGLAYEAYQSRAFRDGDICELIVGLCREASTVNGADDAVYLGFARISVGGVILVGDSVFIGAWLAGRVAGFDGTHLPNHYNIVLSVTDPRQAMTGLAAGCNIGDAVRFVARPA